MKFIIEIDLPTHKPVPLDLIVGILEIAADDLQGIHDTCPDDNTCTMGFHGQMLNTINDTPLYRWQVR